MTRNDALHIHGGLSIHRDGTYSAEPGIDPLRDVVALRSRLLWRLDFIDSWLKQQPSPDRTTEETDG